MAETFKDLGVCDQLVEACENLGWKNPSKIQAEVIPHALHGSFSYLTFHYLIVFQFPWYFFSFSVSSIDFMSFPTYLGNQVEYMIAVFTSTLCAGLLNCYILLKYSIILVFFYFRKRLDWTCRNGFR